jgi:hypothetical protein
LRKRIDYVSKYLKLLLGDLASEHHIREATFILDEIDLPISPVAHMQNVALDKSAAYVKVPCLFAWSIFAIASQSSAIVFALVRDGWLLLCHGMDSPASYWDGMLLSNLASLSIAPYSILLFTITMFDQNEVSQGFFSPYGLLKTSQYCSEMSVLWWTLGMRGLLAVFFGLAALLWPGLTLVVLVSLFGAYALVEGGWRWSFRYRGAGVLGSGGYCW